MQEKFVTASCCGRYVTSLAEWLSLLGFDDAAGSHRPSERGWRDRDVASGSRWRRRAWYARCWRRAWTVPYPISVRKACDEPVMIRPRTWAGPVTRRFQAGRIWLQLKPNLRLQQGRGQTFRDGGAADDKNSRAGSVRAKWRARAAARSADDKGFFSSSRTPAARSLSRLTGAP